MAKVAFTGTSILIEWGEVEFDDEELGQVVMISSITGLISIVDSDGAEVLVHPNEVDSLIDALKEAKNHVQR